MQRACIIRRTLRRLRNALRRARSGLGPTSPGNGPMRDATGREVLDAAGFEVQDAFAYFLRHTDGDRRAAAALLLAWAILRGRRT